MFLIVTTVLLYVFGFVFLYGVIRIAVRHGIEDADSRRLEERRAERQATQRERAFLHENAFLTKN